MSTRRLALTSGLAGALALAWVLTSTAQPRQAMDHLSVTGAGSILVQEGLAKAAPTGADASAFQEVTAPGVRYIANLSRATNVPWIDSNWSRYQRGLEKANYATLPAGSAALAAAEAYSQDVDAILNPDAADVDDLRSMLQFLAAHDRPPLPAVADIGVLDQNEPELDEVLNILTRRNLLYRVVKAPDPTLDLNVKLGTKDFPTEAAANPYEFAMLVRSKLGDEKRSIRVYGTNTVLAHVTADAGRARVFLLKFTQGKRQPVTDRAQAVQLRLLGNYQPTAFAGYASQPGAKLTDIEHPEGATEFWVPDFAVLAIIDLERQK